MALVDDRVKTLAAGVGALVLARCCYGLVSNLAFFLLPSAGLDRYLKTKEGGNAEGKEPWALITGSSAGLGRALAFELAGRGFNIILHGSNAAKLTAVEESLRASHPSRSVRTLVLDARISTQSNGYDLAAKLDHVAKSLEDIELRILINNVGMPQARPELRPPLDTIDAFSYDELLENASGNAIFPLLLTRALYPLLLRSQPALIINMGSLASLGFPLFPSYGPAKSFVMSSTEELRLENKLEGRDIEVLALDVMGVTGTDTINSKPDLMTLRATDYAKAVLRCVGCGYPHVSPYLPHAVFFWVVRALPSWIKDRILVKMMQGKRQESIDEFKSLSSTK